MADITRGGFAKRLCNAYDLSASQRRINALVAWQTAEGTTARFNPLATTLKRPGSTDYNTTHVQNYANLSQGLEATRHTLDFTPGYGYEHIVSAIIAGAPAHDILLAVAQSGWGTGFWRLPYFHS